MRAQRPVPDWITKWAPRMGAMLAFFRCGDGALDGASAYEETLDRLAAHLEAHLDVAGLLDVFLEVDRAVAEGFLGLVAGDLQPQLTGILRGGVEDLGGGAGCGQHGVLRRGVDGELEHIGARVVPHGVEVHLGARNVVEVDLGGEQRVLAIHRPGQHLAQRADDAAAAAHQHRFGRLGQAVVHRVHGELCAAQVLAARQNEAAAFHGDVLQGADPGVTVVGGGRAVQRHALLVHGHAQRGHVVFPADHRPHRAEIGLEGGHGRPIAKAPDQPFTCRWHQLAMLADKPLCPVEIKHGAVQRGPVAFDDTDHGKGASVGSGLGQTGHLRPVKVDGGSVIAGKGGAAFGFAHADGRAEAFAFGIAANQRLGEHDELGPFLRRRTQGGGGFLGGGEAVSRDRGDLGDGDGEGHV